jgi:hypothetical protein
MSHAKPADLYYNVDKSFSKEVFNYVAYFVTPDNVLVFGKNVRSVATEFGDVSSIVKLDEASSTYTGKFVSPLGN